MAADRESYDQTGQPPNGWQVNLNEVMVVEVVPIEWKRTADGKRKAVRRGVRPSAPVPQRRFF